MCDDDDDNDNDESEDLIDLAALLDGSKKKKKKKLQVTIENDDDFLMNSKQSSSSSVLAMDASSNSSSSSGGGCDDDDDDIDSSCCNSSDTSTVENDEKSLQLLPVVGDDDQYTASVRSWVNQVPIGLGLCPWAMKSKREGRLYYRTCQGTTPSDVAMLVRSEAKALVEHGVARLSTTLIVCPHVAAWNNDNNKNNFEIFDEFVKTFCWWETSSWKNHGDKHQQLSSSTSSREEDLLLLQEKITLVTFHPEFVRWRSLPEEVTIGSIIQSYKDMGGFRKSQQLFTATIIETKNSVFGLRKIKVRFHDPVDGDDGGGSGSAYDRNEQYVPVDWLVMPSHHHDEESSSSSSTTQLLPDNAMHRAPYPTVHLIRNQDLGTLCIRDISRVKRKNAQRMMKLGWKGVLQKTLTTTTTMTTEQN